MRRELKEAVPEILPEDKGALWVARCKKRVSSLKEGESLLIDASTFPGRHTMAMRIVREEGGYTLYYVNTGKGITSWHPREEDERGKILNQRVLVFKMKELPDKFFKEFAKASLNKKEPVEKMYGVLKDFLNKPEKRPRESHPELWGRGQFGESCVASSIWALSKTLLLKEELFELETDMRIKALLRSYRQITGGWKRDASQKIAALEQVRKLQGLYEKKGVEKPPVFDEIERQLQERWGLERLEAPLKLRSRKGFKNLLVRGEGGAVFSGPEP